MVSGAMKWVNASISFLFVFVFTFILAGLFLMPHLPPVPEGPVSAFEARFWVDNWVGVLLGILLGSISARSIARKERKKGEQLNRRPLQQ